MGLWVPVLLGETEIDNVHLVTALADTHEEVVGLDVTMNEVPGVNVLDTGYLTWRIWFVRTATAEDNYEMTYQLVGQQEHGLQAELAVAEVEEVFQRGSKQVQDHGIVVALGTEPANERDANTTRE